MLLLPPILASTVVVDCNGPIEINYSVDNGLTFLEMPEDFEVARIFAAYLRLPNTLKFFNPGTSTSLRSLSDTLKDYALRLKTVDDILKEKNTNLSVSDIIDDVNIASKLALLISEEIDKSYASIKRFASRPSCGFVPDLSPVEKMKDLGDLLSNILSRVERVRLRLSETNLTPTEIAALQSLLNSPYSRHEITTLVAAARSDKEILEEVFAPSRESLLDLLELARKTKDREKLRSLMEKSIETKLGSFTLAEAKDFIVTNAEHLRRGDRTQEFLKLYRELERLIEKQDYGAAVFVAEKLEKLAKFILDGGYVEKEDEKPNLLPIGMIVLIAALLFFLWGRRRNEESVDDTIDDDDIINL